MPPVHFLDKKVLCETKYGSIRSIFRNCMEFQADALSIFRLVDRLVRTTCENLGDSHVTYHQNLSLKVPHTEMAKEGQTNWSCSCRLLDYLIKPKPRSSFRSKIRSLPSRLPLDIHTSTLIPSHAYSTPHTSTNIINHASNCRQPPQRP